MTVDPATGVEWVPAFDRQRPPFQPGNSMAVKHGAYSARRTDPLALEVRDEILSAGNMEYLESPRNAVIFWQYCRTAARILVIEEAIDEMDIYQAARSDKGQTSWLELLRKWTATLTNLASRLGLDPLSYARLGKDVTATQLDLAKLLSAPNKPSTKD